MSELKDIGIQLASATVAAAGAVMPCSGKDQKNEADRLAVEAMRETLDGLDLNLHVLLGEGEKDRAPMLYAGERLGRRAGAADSPEFDLVVDPLECTTNFARGLNDSMSVLLAAPAGTIQPVPGTYMEQLLVPPPAAALLGGEVTLEKSISKSIGMIAEALGKRTADLTVVVQDRPRHKYLIDELRAAGAGIALIDSGSLSASFEIIFRPDSRVNVLWGTFGAPEGLLLAFMARAAGCGFLGRVMPHNSRAEKEAQDLNLEGRTLSHAEFIRDRGVLVMSCIHSSTWLGGVEIRPEGPRVRTVVLTNEGLEVCLHLNGELIESGPFRFPE